MRGTGSDEFGNQEFPCLPLKHTGPHPRRFPTSSACLPSRAPAWGGAQWSEWGHVRRSSMCLSPEDARPAAEARAVRCRRPPGGLSPAQARGPGACVRVGQAAAGQAPPPAWLGPRTRPSPRASPDHLGLPTSCSRLLRIGANLSFQYFVCCEYSFCGFLPP